MRVFGRKTPGSALFRPLSLKQFFPERAASTRWVHDRFAPFWNQGIHLQPDWWDDDFTAQTGLNVNLAVNGIARLLMLLSKA